VVAATIVGGQIMRFVSAGVILGVGMGAFLDGIVLHEIAQWHNMGSAVLPPHTMDAMRRNMLWDGQFHLVAWLITLAGLFALWRDRQASAPTIAALTGQMIMGWGLFNLLEGLIDHHLLNLHHVRDLPYHVPAYDWLFLMIGGVGFLVTGSVLWRQGGRSVVAER
jgi:uncharacterized membrane protein